MALPLSLQFPTVYFSPPSQTTHRLRTKLILVGNQSETLKLSISERRRRRSIRNFTAIRAIEEGRQDNESETQTAASSGGGDEPEQASRGGEVTELGMEIKKAMEERKKKEMETGGDLWSGVAAEVKEIEWPAFGKVLGTTGVVLGVIAGSSVVLLTVNAVLAELSDRVFAGKGVQDFFG